MRIININLEDEYPENYDNLDEAKKREIEKYMNDEQETANRHYEKHITTESVLERESYLDLYRHVQDVLGLLQRVAARFKTQTNFSKGI